MAFLALEFVPATLRPGREELLEGLLVGGQVLLEAVHRLFVTLTGLLPAEAAAGHGASTGHRPIDNGELVGIQDGLAAIFLKLVVAAVMSPAAPSGGEREVRDCANVQVSLTVSKRTLGDVSGPEGTGVAETSDSSPEALGLFGEVCKLNPGSSDWVGLSIPQGIARSPSPEK